MYLGSLDSTATNSDDATHVDCAPGSFHEFDEFCNLCVAVSFGGSPTGGFWSNYLIVFVSEALAVCYCCGDDHDNIEDGGRRRTRATTRTATTRRHQEDDDEDDDENDDEDEDEDDEDE